MRKPQKFQVKRNPNKSKPEFKNDYGHAFIIGNGTTRKDKNLEPLMDQGILFGCNYFYREMHPHVLVLSDPAITDTVAKVDKKWCKRNHVFSWHDKPGGTIKKVAFPEKTSAGLMAAFEAIETFRCKNIFLIGMDFFGLGSNGKEDNGIVNNLYSGEKHYVPEGSAAPTYRNWQRRFQYVLRKYPYVEFYHVNPLDGKSPERLLGADNWHQITWENMMDHLENGADLVDLYEKTEEDKALFYAPNPDDIRASIERQFAFQENKMYPDKIHPEHCLSILMQTQQAYLSGQVGPQGVLTVNIKEFEVTVPPVLYPTPSGPVLLPLENLRDWYMSQCHVRYNLDKTVLEPFKVLTPKNSTPPLNAQKNFAVPMTDISAMEQKAAAQNIRLRPPPPPPSEKGSSLDIPPPPPPPPIS